jgi:molybdopterin-guanine dinucleotide biosynthesis protein A
MTIGGIMAGGMGSRLLRDLGERKPLLRLEGRTLLQHVADQLKDAGIEDLIIGCRADDEEVMRHASELEGFAGRVTFAHPEPGGGTGKSIRAILRSCNESDCMISTVDTIAPSGTYKRLLDYAKRQGNEKMVTILATGYIHDDQPIWIHVDESNSVVTDLGKSIEPAELCFGNVRWVSAEGVERLSEFPPCNPDADTLLMREFIHEYPGKVGILRTDPIFDLDDGSDVALAAQWLKGLTSIEGAGE